MSKVIVAHQNPYLLPAVVGALLIIIGYTITVAALSESIEFLAVSARHRNFLLMLYLITPISIICLLYILPKAFSKDRYIILVDGDRVFLRGVKEGINLRSCRLGIVDTVYGRALVIEAGVKRHRIFELSVKEQIEDVERILHEQKTLFEISGREV